MEIRTLKASEIEARVQSVKKNGLILLLYKDARCDMRILDETFGIGNWQRSHQVVNGNLFCNVGVRFERENSFSEWVWKQDVGTESNAEKEKGQASDSFKRACFNWGIGRELYTAPFIWINDIGDINNGKCFTKFKVKEIEYNEYREINRLVIEDEKGNIRYTYGNKKQTSTQEILIDKAKVDTLLLLAKQIDADLSKTLDYYGVSKVEDLNVTQFTKIVDQMKKVK